MTAGNHEAETGAHGRAHATVSRQPVLGVFEALPGVFFSLLFEGVASPILQHVLFNTREKDIF